MTIRIVTDSACDVPAAIAAALNITVIPVYINVGEKSYLDGVELTREEFFANLADYPVVPTTAAPSTGAFTAVYQQLVAEGATEIISIHIASKLSATYNAARLGAQEVTGATVTLFDTEQITMGAGLLVMIAAEAAAAGHSVPEIMTMLQERVGRTHIYAALDTLEFLRRSGRVNWAQFGLGTLLRIKPVLYVHAGEVTVAARVRTFSRAVEQVISMVEACGALERVAVLHTQNLEGVKTLQAQAAHLLAAEQTPIVMEITPAIGAHVGPGALGFAFITAA